MASSAADDASMRCVTAGTATGDFALGGGGEWADFIRAVSIGLNDLEAGREISFDDAAIRLGLD
jgi:hypothetical protein